MKNNFNRAKNSYFFCDAEYYDGKFDTESDES